MTSKRRKVKVWLKRNRLYLVLFIIVLISTLFTIDVVTYFTKKVNEVNFTESVIVGEVMNEAPLVTEPIVEEEEPKVFYFDVPLSHELQDYIRELCTTYDVPMELVIAMIEKESTFRENVVSKTNDYGLMQINVINHDNLKKKLGVTNLLDPYQNVLSGIYIISGHLNKTGGDIELALMRYNAGGAGAKKMWDKGIYSTKYSRSIMSLYQSYKEKAAHGAATP